MSGMTSSQLYNGQQSQMQASQLQGSQLKQTDELDQLSEVSYNNLANKNELKPNDDSLEMRLQNIRNNFKFNYADLDQLEIPSNLESSELQQNEEH